MNFWRSKRFIVAAGALAALLAGGAVLAQVSSNYDLRWNVLSGGGGTRNSANYRIGDTLGQWVGDASTSANYRVAPGFWPGAAFTTTVLAPSLRIGKSAPALARTGANITYTLTLTNNGTAGASNLVVTDTLPAGATYRTGGTRNGNVVNWTLASLNTGASATVTFVVTATQTVTNSQYRVSATGGYTAVGALPVVTQVSANIGDAYEADNTCAAARTIATNNTAQTHDFHVAGDEDWVKFTAQANKTYVISVANVGAKVDAVVLLFDACGAPPAADGSNAFGPTVQMEWDAPAAGTYYLQVVQNDPGVFGAGTNYNLSIAVDTQAPSAPRSLRAAAGDQTLTVQWRKPPERDVTRYRIRWGENSGVYSGVDEVDGADNTYHQIAGLVNGTTYYIVVNAIDLSGNVSLNSVEIAQIPAVNADATTPVVTPNRPSTSVVHTTTLPSLTVGGICTDTANNLSRIRARNTTSGQERWNYGLTGGSAQCLVDSLPLAVGDNTVQLTVFDSANNAGNATITIRRLTGQNGAAVIVGGRNNSGSVQANINNATNRAYRGFRAAGFAPEEIFYLSTSPQDADGDGASDVISTTTPVNVHAALQWAAGRLGSNVPFYLYLMDHGVIEGFCASSCDAGGRVSPSDLNSWLNALETACGGCKVTVIIETCHSGSFIDRFGGDLANSISEDGRVVIASTGRTNNAYASADGAYFSDAFFSAVAESQSVMNAFNQAKAAVEATPFNQTPWLDDNGDGLYSPADGGYASTRYVASFFGGMLPQVITTSVRVSGTLGALSARVERSDAEIDQVWAVVYPPNFTSPTTTTLELGVPTILLQPDAAIEGLYKANYNGFNQPGAYRVVFYATDKTGNQALPKLAQTGLKKVFLPLVRK
jgi:uncharacterized repeat protein (TIGR01451 family)